MLTTRGQLAIVLAFAALGAASLWYWGAPSGEHVQRKVEAQKEREFEERVVPVLDEVTAAALTYIDAVIDCDCEGIVKRTEWIRSREARLSASGATPAEIANDRVEFCESFCTREPEGFVLVDEGVEDPYLFFPGVEYEYVGQDEGRDDLEVPVVSRAWVALRFPSPSRCVKDPDGRAISGVTVGLNLTADGTVAKAGVLGNTEIKWDSVRYSW